MNWTKQKWRTKSGKPSTQGPKATGERYLPSAAIKNMSASQYAASTRKKREDTKKGKQHSANQGALRVPQLDIDEHVSAYLEAGRAAYTAQGC